MAARVDRIEGPVRIDFDWRLERNDALFLLGRLATTSLPAGVAVLGGVLTPMTVFATRNWPIPDRAVAWVGESGGFVGSAAFSFCAGDADDADS